MRFQTLIPAGAKTCVCVAALLVSACGNQWKARRADEAYQRALAQNDLIGERDALQKLTTADEDVSDYWIRLAKVELEIGSYGGAYQHLSRAHELDRTDVSTLSMMTELAVINGRLDLADIHLKELLVIAPSDRAVAVARGFGALREGNYEKAEANAAILLKQSPNDSIGNVLETRILITQKKIPEAIELLEHKLLASGNDRAMLRSLAAIYRFNGEWQKAAPLDLKLWRLSPQDPNSASQAVFDALKADNHLLALTVTERVLSDSKSKDELNNVLTKWVKIAPSDGSLSTFIPANASDLKRIAFAHYLNQVGRANQALIVLGPEPRPLGRANVPFNAVLGETFVARGQAKTARELLDSVLSDEADNEVALAARARLLSALGDHRRAIADAQRLIASYANNPDYRVLLSKVYGASGDKRDAERTLWDGYRDLPLAESLYNEVRRVLMSRGDTEGAMQLGRGYEQEKYSQLLRELA